MKLRDYLAVVWRRRLLVLAAALIGAAAVWFVGQPPDPTDPTYSGEVTIAAKETEAPTTVLLYSQVTTRTQAISSAVADLLGDDYYDTDATTIEVLEASVGVQADAEVGTLELWVLDQPDEETALLVLNGYTDALIDYALNRRTLERDQQIEALELREASLNERITELEADIETAAARLTEDELARGVPADRVKEAQLVSSLGLLTETQADINSLRNQTPEQLTPVAQVGSAEVRAGEIEMSPLDFGQRLIVGIALATLLGIGLAFALHKFDSRLFARKDAEAAFGLPVLAEIPKVGRWTLRKGGVLTRSQPGSLVAESFRLLRSSLAHTRMLQMERLGLSGDGSGTVTLVASAAAGAGKTTIAANLAVASVDAGKSVLIIGADLREPKIQEQFEIDPTIGITDAVKELQSSGQLQLEQYLTETGVQGVTLLANGGPVPNPGETLALIRPIVDAVKQRYDVILIDSPPMLVGNDVNELIPFADLVLLVARSGKTTLDEAEWVEETASRLEAPTCGVALVGARSELERRDKSLFSRIFRRKKDGDADAAGLGPSIVTQVPPAVSPNVVVVAEPTPAVVQAATPAPVVQAVPAAPAATTPSVPAAANATPAVPAAAMGVNATPAVPAAANGSSAPATPAAAAPTQVVPNNGVSSAPAAPATPAAQAPATPAAQPPAATPATPTRATPVAPATPVAQATPVPATPAAPATPAPATPVAPATPAPATPVAQAPAAAAPTEIVTPTATPSAAPLNLPDATAELPIGVSPESLAGMPAPADGQIPDISDIAFGPNNPIPDDTIDPDATDPGYTVSSDDDLIALDEEDDLDLDFDDEDELSGNVVKVNNRGSGQPPRSLSA